MHSLRVFTWHVCIFAFAVVAAVFALVCALPQPAHAEWPSANARLVFDAAAGNAYRDTYEGVVGGWVDAAHGNKLAYVQIGDRCYTPHQLDNPEPTVANKDGNIEQSIMWIMFADGELRIQNGLWVPAEKVAGQVAIALNAFREPMLSGLALELDSFYGPRPEQVKTVTFDTSYMESLVSHYHVGAGVVDPYRVGGDACLTYTRTFKNCKNLTEVRGLDVPSAAVFGECTQLFAGCTGLRELDLSGVSLRHATSLQGIFDGCVSLERLVVGDEWKYERPMRWPDLDPNWTGLAEQYRPTFPVDMTCTAGAHAGETFVAGEVIPPGAGTYECNRVHIDAGQVRLYAPGSAQESAELSGPLEYTGAAIVPRVEVTVEVDGQARQLVCGKDFTVRCEDNVDPGTARVAIWGIGDYMGELTTSFEIVDTAACALFYGNGTLVLQATHEPNAGIAGSNSAQPKCWTWFYPTDAVRGGTVPWDAVRGQVKRVIIHSSFARFLPTSTQDWFAGCANLASVEGLRYLNARECTSMARMFAGCASLEAFDFSGLNARDVTDFDGFLDGCSALRSLSGGFWPSAAPVFPHDMFCEAQGYKRFAAGEPVPSRVPVCTRGITLRWAKVVTATTLLNCTERPIELDLHVFLGETELVEGTDYVVTYENNIWPGQATATIEARGAFTGGLIVPFTIIDNYVHVGDRLVYFGQDVEYTMRVLSVRNAQGRTMSTTAILERIEVKNRSLKTLTIPGQCTVGGVRVDITAVGSKLSGKFGNVKCVIVGPKVVTIGAKAFAKAKKVVKLKVKSARLAKVTNCLKGSKVKRVETRVKLEKSRQKTYKKWFTKKAGKKGVKYSYKP